MIPFSKSLKTKYQSYKSLPNEFEKESLQIKGTQFRARLVEDYVWCVVQTLLGLGSEDPRLNQSYKIDFRLQHMMSFWKNQYPYPNRVKLVPLWIIRTLLLVSENTDDPYLKATNNMIVVAVYFLFRPGEYTA